MSFTRSTIRKANKVHQCDRCDGEIQRKELYRNSMTNDPDYVEDGFLAWKECRDCLEELGLSVEVKS